MLRIANDCAAKGHDVKIYTGQWRGDPPGNNIEVVCLKSSGLLNHRRHQSLIDAMMRHLEQDPPDLVVGFNRMPGLDVYFAADPCFVERAHTERGWWYRWTGRYRFFAATEKAVMGRDGHCRILLLSPREKKIYQHWYSIPDSRFYILPPNIPSKAFADINQAIARQELRTEFGLPDHAKVVLLVGSAFTRKGLDRAIKGLSELPEPIKRNTWLIAVGEDRAKPMISLARRLGVGSQVKITPGRTDVPQLMAGADLLVHPARSELAGIVLIEGLTAGLPILVTDVCGYAAHVRDADAGLVLSSPFNQADLGEALATMLTSPRIDEWRLAARRYTANILANTSSTVEADWLERFASEKKD